ncbi:MAG: PilC/PilY family type IV pilus protein [Pseudomonadota bacterium]|nr:PilC/PilY family type IV pilus protein [Pseudomonadota bacterium]
MLCRVARPFVAALALASLAMPAAAALTDISDSPIAGTTGAQTKPNIMLLMDASGSMGWSHMPDEVEVATGIGSIGYKSAQCNVLYYNPLTVYALPKKPDGSNFPTPFFGAARYTGFGDYATPINVAVTDLSSSFRAYDGSTLRVTTSTPDAAQAAYYYVYSGPQTLSYGSAACRQADVNAPVPAVGPGGGNWARKIVSTTSGPGASDELQNFAIWYSFYRTRIALIKSAASLAFTPLTNSFRVGFITVEPKNTRTSPAINALDHYVPINDFDAAQRTTWFNQLFAQIPKGASPTREGLARVGRHYAGRQDGINTGMYGDPVQFSCQQNFTILTTDGYWNSQTETPGGGPVKIDGVTRVGQQDGTLTSNAGLSPRPIWEGFASDTSVETDKVNTFAYAPCGAFFNRSTSQLSRSTTQNTTTTSQMLQNTQQVATSTQQLSGSTSQINQSSLQHTQSTSQVSLSTSQWSASTSQLTMSTSQTQQTVTQEQQRTEQVSQSTTQQTMATTQDTQSTSQLTQSQVQIQQATSRVDASTSQLTIGTSQLQQTTTQASVSTSQLQQSTSQLQRTDAQVRESTSFQQSCSSLTELCTAVPTGSCSPGGDITCETVTTGPTLVASCTPETESAGNAWTTTTCATTTSPAAPVGSCMASLANSGNGFTTTTCNTVTGGPTGVASCSPAAPAAGNAFTQTSCNTATTGPTLTSTCAAAAPTAINSYVATTCGTVTTGPTGVASCTPAAASAGNSYVATSCNTATTGPVGTASCTPAPASGGNSWTATNCSTASTGPTPVSSCTPAGASSGNSWVDTTCTPVTTGPAGAASCSASGPTAINSWTTTTCPSIVSGPTGVASCTNDAATSSNGYTQTTCNTVVTGPTGVPPASCVVTAANAGNSYVATACGTVTTAVTPVPLASCPASSGPTSGNDYVTTTCATNTTGPTLVASCSASPANSGNAYTGTTCTTNPPAPAWSDVASCTPVAASAGNGYTATYCRTNTVATTNVGACTPSGPSLTGGGVTCSTVSSGPIGVASCAPQTGNAGNGWLTISCNTVTSGPTFVASCSNSAAASGNAWTTTTCSQATTGPTLVASCTPDAANSGNSFTSTTCSTASTSAVGVSSCTPVAASGGNGYTTTNCVDVILGPTPVASCSPVTAASGNSWVETTCNTIATGPTLTANCSPAAASISNGWTQQTCAAPVLTGPTPSASCTPAVASAGNSFVSTTCSNTTSAQTAVASCTPVPAASGNAWTETVCTPATNVVGSASCTPIGPNSGNGFTTTMCSTVSTGPTLVAACTPQTADNTNGWVDVTCSNVTTGPTATASCANDPASSSNSYVATTCTPAGGRKIQYSTLTTVTTTLTSGGFSVGPPTVTTSTAGPTDLGACYATGTEPALPTPNPQSSGITVGPTAPAPCTSWPCTVATANAGGSIDSLADVAQYYYATDLRTGPLWDGVNNNVPAVGGGPEDDRANWQHMTTFTVALGVSGSLEYRPDYKSASAVTGDFAHIRTGAIPLGDTSGTGATIWPLWPDPALNYDGNAGGNFQLWNNPKSIDDFWHTAVNGRGKYFSAGDPGSVVAGLSAALAGTGTRLGSGTGIGVSSFKPVLGDNFAYSPTYVTSDWSGDVKASEIDTSTGVVSPTVIWSAQSLLNAKVGAACDNRTIKLIRQGAIDNLVNFTANTKACDGSGNPIGSADNGLNLAEMANFNASKVALFSQYLAMTDGTAPTVDQRTAAAGANLVNFVRGQRGLEGFTPNNLNTLYRTRAQVLGDIIGGQPVYVRAPFADYQDSLYDTFKLTWAGRTPMVYVAANDGMLHAFYAGTSAIDINGGKEAWAIVPSTVLPNLYKLADVNYRNNHQFFVDGTPTVGDAYDGTNWKTVLVGGLNAGGKGYYALDVTDPASPKGLWEFKWDPSMATCPLLTSGATNNSADCHLGFTFGKPIISKLSTGAWVVMFASGYNNINSPALTGDGQGYLYVLDAFTGKIMYKISTNAGTDLVPSGLAQINNFVDASLQNNTTKAVYGGDMLGNIWRFDVNDTLPPLGREASLIGVAKDPSNNPQPITTRPELAELNNKPMVFVGTGRLLGTSDFADMQVQSVYGIVDPLFGNPAYPNLRGALKALTLTTSGGTRTDSCGANCGSASGWVLDLPETGERVNVDMKLARGTLAFGSNIPEQSACVIGGHSWLNFVSFSTGLAVTTSPGLAVSVQSTGSLTVGLNLIEVQGRLIGVRTFADATKTSPEISFDAVGPSGKRISWREIAR